MISRIGLGGSKFREISQNSVTILLSAANDLNINVIDIAPTYGDGEVKIGVALKKMKIRSDFKISTKILRYDVKITKKVIKNSLDQSLRNLNSEYIDFLALHGTDLKRIDYESWECLLDQKKKGKILNIGYSGDGQQLNSAFKDLRFDFFYAPINILDQDNYQEFINRKCEYDLFAVSPLGKTYWNYRQWNKVKAVYMARIRKIYNNEPLNYLEKAKQIDVTKFANVESYIRFVSWLPAVRCSIIGISNTDHLKEIVRASEKGPLNAMTLSEIEAIRVNLKK
jgi:aryl-alcohol dehydrogenase-like predicted oxidoreductase